MINLRGTIVPIVDLRVRFGFAHAADAACVVIILNLAAGVVGAVVDSVNDVVALADGDIRATPEVGGAISAGFIRGIAPMGDRMLIVFDIARLVTSADFGLVEARAA